MSKTFFVVITMGVLVFSSVSLGYTGGSGTPEQPYQITTKADLLTLAATAEDYNKCFILTADINMEDQVFFTTSAIIGAADFTGTFDGNSHKITHFTIDGGSNDHLGLFGSVGSSGSVKNLGLEDCTVSASSDSQCVGGLVGYNRGIIINCCSTGSVGGSYYVGGLVGNNFGTVTSCCSKGSISSTCNAGGLVGENYGSINNCYATGSVSSPSGGGLVGDNEGGSISNCYSTGTVSGQERVGGLVGVYSGSVYNSFWDIQTSGQTTSSGGEGKTTAQMQDINTFLNAGWDFINETANGTCNYWLMPPDAYPALSVLNGFVPLQPLGSGTENAPYVITDANDLGTVWFRPSAHYVLAGDINLSGITWSMAVVPAFSGVFDGNAFCINNLLINGAGFLGLFGTVYPGSQIKDLTLENCIVSGTGRNVGGLVGYSYSGISNSYSSSIVNGDMYVGGLVGYSYNSSISNSHSSSIVNGYMFVGGLVGYNDNGSVTDCCSAGAVSGLSYYVGGLVGYNDYGSIINCYATYNISGNSYTGGLVGENFRGCISNCYATGTANGWWGLGGLIGENFRGSIIDCYATGSVSGPSNSVLVGGLVGENFRGSITNCYSTAVVSGAEGAGGLIGFSDGSISWCYFLITSGPDNGYGQPLTDAQMKQQASFYGWDFTTPVWVIKENVDYPRLRWAENVLYVPGYFPTIQSAIDAAVNGDVVYVAPGTYTGPGNRNIDFLGKAITVRSQSGPDNCIIDCRQQGRGFCFHNAEDANSILDGFTITNGYAEYHGGGICCEYGSNPAIINCTITGNSTWGYGGGISCDVENNTTITSCTITGNTAYEGGGIFCMCFDTIEITDCVIGNNMAEDQGGGIYCYGGKLALSNCIISGNWCGRRTLPSQGGGIYCDSDAVIKKCTISGNISEIGGGICCDGSNSIITSCTIIGNSAYYGGGIYNYYSAPTLANCILWGNTAPTDPQINSSATVSFSDVQDGYPGLGNIDIDPCFVDADANDYHLKSEGWRWDVVRQRWTYDDVTSRCIDAGNPGSPLGDELLSVPDDPDNEWGQNLRIDMGAFGGTAEASIPPYDWALLADITNDGIVNLEDYVYQAADWLNSADQQPGDLNRDSLVNISDLALLIEDWLGQTSWHE